MSLVAPVVDGVLQTSTASSESLSKSKSNGNSINSDTFLTLLVAEMQNQDPLEPTSNTEWVSQYATFTQVEQIGEMADSMDVLRANSLIGKEVIMKVISESTGETSYQRGIVDYIVMENGEALLNIGGSNYSMDDLDTVASDEYYEAYDFYTEFVKKIDALPSLKAIDKSYENTVGELYVMYNNMTEYQSEYLKAYAPLYIENYELYIKKMEQFGITFEYLDAVENQDVTTKTLDDVIATYEEKMEALMAQIAAIGEKVSSSQENNSSGNTDASNAGSADNASGSTGNTGGADNASGGTGNVGSTDNASGGTDNAGSADNASGDTDNASGNTDNAGSAGNTGDVEGADNVAAANEAAQNTATPEAGGEDSQVSDDTLDLLTQDI